jgi:hypothetical protein
MLERPSGMGGGFTGAGWNGTDDTDDDDEATAAAAPGGRGVNVPGTARG